MQPSSELRAVIFDLDGTLIDSMPLVLRAFAHALEPFRPDLGIEDIFQRLGGPPARTLLELTGDESKAAEALRRLEGFGFDNGALVQPFIGMRGMLDALHKRGLSMAVWTGRDRFTTQAILSAHNLEQYFKVVVCGDDLATHKPHPEGLVAILRKLGIAPQEALYAGDADADVLGGAEAGVRTILIRHGREVDESITRRAWRQVEGPAEAYAAIAEAVTRTR
jgi:phosphoglycolate phosphatase-like HAD superfamily hydrolase